MTAQVRAAAADDIAAIREVGRTTWPATYSFAGDDYVATGLATWWSDTALQRSIEETTVLVAVDSGQVVGVGNVDVRRRCAGHLEAVCAAACSGLRRRLGTDGSPAVPDPGWQQLSAAGVCRRQQPSGRLLCRPRFHRAAARAG